MKRRLISNFTLFMPNRHRLCLRGNQGVTMIEVVIAIGLMAVAGATMIEVTVNNERLRVVSELFVQKQAMKQRFVNVISCAQSLAPTGCSPGDPMDLMRDSATGPQVEVPKEGIQIGKYEVRGMCNDAGDGLVLEGVLKPRVKGIANCVFGQVCALLFPSGINLCRLETRATVEYGGSFSTHLNNDCLFQNSFTGGCGCPAGFTDVEVFNFPNPFGSDFLRYDSTHSPGFNFHVCERVL